MKKSEMPKTPPKGNAAKYLSYREAWARIKVACQEGFYLEAITLQESIITDRLISYLTVVGEIQKPTEVHQYPSFGKLIQLWKKQNPLPIEVGGQTSLQEAVDQWRILRNQAVHGMVKSHPGTPTVPVDDFLAVAERAAHEGTLLAKTVSEWCRKIRKYQEKENYL
ncbi:hypothetical protein [Fortiea sp. LEGE XX443]|uniref:hypothetical protein n=1 Tax=Fortiea sp. LEGE XX443 TaxID=1828611 RepID=UPI001D14F125|nr:hypothetical protein [Fortiea sp. LEGE XX443]